MLHESRDGPLLPLVLFLLIQRETFLAKLLALNLCNLVIVIVFVTLSLSFLLSLLHCHCLCHCLCCIVIIFVIVKPLALNLCILVKCCISWSQSEETSPQLEKMQVSGEQEMWSILSCRPLHTTWHGLHDGHDSVIG